MSSFKPLFILSPFRVLPPRTPYSVLRPQHPSLRPSITLSEFRILHSFRSQFPVLSVPLCLCVRLLPVFRVLRDHYDPQKSAPISKKAARFYVRIAMNQGGPGSSKTFATDNGPGPKYLPPVWVINMTARTNRHKPLTAKDL